MWPFEHSADQAHDEYGVPAWEKDMKYFSSVLYFLCICFTGRYSDFSVAFDFFVCYAYHPSQAVVGILAHQHSPCTVRGL